MPGYWITLHDRPARSGHLTAGTRVDAAPSTGAALPAAAALAERLGCRWCWWASDSSVVWEAAFRGLGLAARQDVFHMVGPSTSLDNALDRAGYGRSEVDMDPDTGEPMWPALHGALFVVDHRHGIPARPPAGADRARILEDATTGLCGSVHGQPVGSFGRAVVLTLGTPLLPRSTGAVIATGHTGTADTLQRETELVPLDRAADDALRSDLASMADRVEAFQAAAAVYDSAWRGKDLALRVIQPRPSTSSSRSEYMIGVRDPDGLAAALADEGVEARRPLNARLRRVLLDRPVLFPGAGAFYSRAVQLPSHPALDLGELLFVADLVVRHMRGIRA